MSTDRSKPYIEGKPGDLLTASMWNAAQIEAKKDIASEIVSLEARMKDSLVAGATALKTASLSAETGSVGTLSAVDLKATALSADKGTVSALKVGDLEVTGKLSGSASTGVKLYTATASYGAGSIYGNNGLSWHSQDQYLGGQMVVPGSYGTGYWGWGGPGVSINLTTTSLVQLQSRWTWWITGGGQYYRWAQFIVGSSGKWAPVRTNPGSYAGEHSASNSYNRPSEPNASNFLTSGSGWLDYHHTYYSNYTRWPMAGLTHQVTYNSYNYTSLGHVPVQHTELIELPAGSYTFHMGFSGYNQYIANLQLQALVFPGGSNG